MAMAMAIPDKLLSTRTILSESFKLILGSSYHFVFILLLSLVSASSLFFSSNHDSIYSSLARPICSRVTDITTLSASIEKTNIKDLVLLLTSFVIASFLTPATIHAFSMAYAPKSPYTNIFMKTKQAWKSSFVSQSCVTILHSCFVLSMDPILLGLTVMSHDSKILVVMLVLVAVLSALYYFYVAIVSLLCLVVSAVEEECYGIEAFGRALELISRRRKQGIAINVLVVVLSSVATLVFMVFFSSSSDSEENQLWIEVVRIGMDVVLNFLILATTTALYYECKKSERNESYREMEECIVDVYLLTNP
ncbi:hypothetical protein ZIOFF_017717 [Zingiber officinale]|uniref:Uncharacterized protein n=1 Tax=Zingiber officinale TaxID=94328 RepID=A0A8J5H5F6_ZINOF|nr:hypothetical protein ZIOFF_017717 [Zingiber officinale]